MSEVENLQGQAENPEGRLNDLVVVGSSSGGVEALSILVSTLPPDFPAPIVLAQHLDPNRPSSLDVILQRRTTLPVEMVSSSSLLESGKIYVVPSNRNVTIRDGHVEVKEDNNKRTRPKPSVDGLLLTAAEVYGDRLIAVILTGSGSDGAAGAVEVKNAGGTVIVQDPQTARYPSMPLALPPTVIDFETDIEHISPLLYDLLTGVGIRRTEEKTDDILQGILKRVNRQANIDFRPYKTSTILRRIGRRMTITHNQTMRDYLEYQESHPEEVGELIKDLLINVTQFFRDSDAFAYLKDEILPELLARARERDRVLRLWTAACATGEEPYSLAMLLTDLLGAELPEWSVKIFATDLDESAINFARRGFYPENLLKGVPANYLDRFFERVDDGYRISKMLRQMVIFGQQDLSRSAPFPHIDLVLCRNVLIYFTPELQEYVLNQFAFSLSPGGYLFLGKAETVRPTHMYYELINKHWKVYRCTGSALPITNRQSFNSLNASNVQRRDNRLMSRLSGKEYVEASSSPSIELGQIRRLNELLLRFLPVGVVVIDRSYRVMTANGSARRLLGMRELGAEQDFLHSARGIPYTIVRNAIDAVFRERNAVTLPEIALDDVTSGNGRYVALSIALMQMEAGMPDLATITVVDVTEQVHMKQQLETVQVEQAQLLRELSAGNKRLNDVNKELLDSNEELQVANEELVLTHEELQATLEEFETTNEELQATNEELETNNEELQATNEELETTNEELRARTSELQELTNLLESDRVRLSEMVELSPFYIMVLRGPSLIVEAFNPRYTGLLEGRGVQGLPFDEVYDLFWEAGIAVARLAREVYQHDVMRTSSRMLMRVQKGQSEPIESYFTYTLVPSHDASRRVTGVIVYAVDETEQRAKADEEELHRLRLIFDNANVSALALYDAQSTELLMGSPRYLTLIAQIRGLKQSELIGRRWHELTFVSSGEEADQLWNTVLERRTPFHLSEVHLKITSDEPETVSNWSLIPILDKDKQDSVRFILVSAVEVTEQIQARQKMEELNQLREDFFSLVGHELRTPLTSILGNAELLQRNLKKRLASTSNEAQKEIQHSTQNLDSMIYQIHRMSKLIEEMVDLTRIRSELFQLETHDNVSLVELVERIVKQQSATTSRSIKFETQEEFIQGTTDENRFEQVLNNLITNAIKYSPADKPVRVGVERGQENELVVWVQDQGEGISEEDQAYIFNRFYRARAQEISNVDGLGLGLYIAHELVTRLGGRMWLESKPGAGSTFYFSVPV